MADLILAPDDWGRIRETGRLSYDQLSAAAEKGDAFAYLELEARSMRKSIAQYIPLHMREAIERYILYGAKVGDFLFAVLSNDLMDAFGRADEINRACMFQWTCFLFTHAPAECYRSPSNVKRWQAEGGYYGRHLAAVARTAGGDTGTHHRIEQTAQRA